MEIKQEYNYQTALLKRPSIVHFFLNVDIMTFLMMKIGIIYNRKECRFNRNFPIFKQGLFTFKERQMIYNASQKSCTTFFF
jgi:hypothetical protein